MKRNGLTFFALTFIAAVLLLGGLSHTTHAAPSTATIIVNTLDDENNSDGDCSLREAIASANTDTAVDACTAGSGDDTIQFSLSGTINLSSLLVISSNVIIDASGQSVTLSGGGSTRILDITSGVVTLQQLTLTNGYNNGGAGAIYSDGTLTINNSTFTGNSVTSDSSGTKGGAIINYGPLTINNSTFTGNSASSTADDSGAGGGAIYSAGSLTINNSTFTGNSVSVTGANSGAFGGAIEGPGPGAATINNSTITDNSANAVAGSTARGGGVYAVTLHNSIVANNTATTGDGDCRAVSADAYNLDGDGSCQNATTKTPAELNLGALANNGGPTQTIAFSAGSAAINTGNNATCTTTDQRGVARPQNGVCDVGAYELLFCLAGSYSNGFSCVPSPAGSYVPTGGATSPTLCPEGKYQPNQGATLCLNAPVNTYVNTQGSIAPTPCAPHFYTWVTGSVACQAAVTVTTLLDENDDCVSGVGCSLREAIVAATNGDTIDFAVTGTIGLGSVLVVDKSVTIYGNMPITVSGNNAVRVFFVNAGTFVTLDSLTIANGNTPEDGGGIYNSGTLKVNNSTISGNSAGTAGGGIINNSGALTVNNSTLSGNSAGNAGGGILNNGTLTVNNSTLYGNSATVNGGGGIFNNGGTLTVNNSTLSGNNGGGLEQLYLNSGTLNLGNTIIANSLSPNDCVVDGGTFNDLGNNLIEDTGTGACGLVNGVNGNIIGSDPSLGALANNGGSTRTHALLPGSLAINAGNCTSGPTSDQRGATRPQNATCDIGAYEETGTLQCGIAAGNSYAFPTQSGVSILVNSESDLDCLYVDRLPFNHPHATGLTDGANLRTGQYWQIRGLQADGITPATTFNVDLTLPYATASASTRACKWLDGVGPSFGWNCLGGGMGTTFGAGTVTRQGVTAFSQWAVGDEVGPTAVTLAQHSAQTTSFSNTLWLWGIALLLLTLWAWRTVRIRREMMQG